MRALELNENQMLHKIVREKSDFVHFYHILSKIRPLYQESGLFQIEFLLGEKNILHDVIYSCSLIRF